jgi:hypothetical protein
VKTYLAGAVLNLSEIESTSPEYKWISDSLVPGSPPRDDTSEAATLYWERRWGASKMIGRLGPKGKQFKPQLERLQEHEETPGWVKQRLSMDIRSISVSDTQESPSTRPSSTPP